MGGGDGKRADLASTESTYLPIGSPTDNNRLYLLGAGAEQVQAVVVVSSLHIPRRPRRGEGGYTLLRACF
ncbi:hypothetical protein [Pseudomonas aeruginosa]|uniref:hypothetical protein n=1 Tax=Pseudomonas aeruginosa TaxID=287 RepID=UPI000D691C61